LNEACVARHLQNRLPDWMSPRLVGTGNQGRGTKRPGDKSKNGKDQGLKGHDLRASVPMAGRSLWKIPS